MRVKHIIFFSLSEINKNDQRGASLIFAIIFTTLFTVMIYVMATMFRTNTRMDALTIGEQQSFYLAESGLEYAVKKSTVTSSYNWQDTLNYEGGEIIIDVASMSGDTVLFTSTGKYGMAAKRNTLAISSRNFATDYAVYISGDINGTLYGDIDLFRTNQTDFIDINLATLKALAQSQGTYYTQANKSINWKSSCSFWSDPSDPNSPPNVIYAEKNLTIEGPSGKICGIIISAGGWIKFKYDGIVNGIVYIADDHERNLNGTGQVNGVVINGGVVGSIKFLAQGQFTANINSTYLSAFYNYATDPSQLVQINRLNWQSVY
jgi:TM2 domain-containing membrane protein YozV